MLGLLFSDMSIFHVFEKKMEIKSPIPEQQIVSSADCVWNMMLLSVRWG